MASNGKSFNTPSGTRSTWTRLSLCIGIAAMLSLVAGCAHLRSSKQYFTAGESVVLAGEEPAMLNFAPLLTREVIVRSTYRPGLSNTVVYEPMRDYRLDAIGRIRRTPGSRIPDFSTNVLFGKEDFNHQQFPGFGNNGFFAYVDYWHAKALQYTNTAPDLDARLLPSIREKLRKGEPVKIIAFGDSITAGGDTSVPQLIFWERWASHLRQKYPKSKIIAVNGATGGDSTGQGLQRLDEKVLTQAPDLVLVGFGMNDHNIQGYGVPVPQFTQNLATIVDRIRSSTKAEVILFSAFPPNPKWHFGSHNMAAYAAATEQLARTKGCAFADVYGRWLASTTRKKPEDVLANNINHPNDYSHGLYLDALKNLGL